MPAERASPTPRCASSSAAPIGSFQAVKHKCARLFARTELAHGRRLGRRRRHASKARGSSRWRPPRPPSCGPPSAVDIALDTITLLGGIGYTWEHDVHLYWRRAMSLAALLGPRGAWQQRLTGLSRATERQP